jgi:hypothetical protein
MKRTILVAALLAATALCGCETATPYQPLHAQGAKASGGYYDHQIEANRFEVGFAGNSLTKRDSVERFLLYRSAELTLAQGYDWFEAVHRHVGHKSEFYATPGPYGAWGGYWSPRWGFYRAGFGWRYGYWGDPFMRPDVERVDRYTASSEIFLGRGPKPEGRQAFDAHAVVESLRGAVISAPKA